MFRETALLYWLAETARALFAAADGAGVVTLVRDRIETLLRAETRFHRSFDGVAYVVDDLDGEARGAVVADPAIVAGFTRARSGIEGTRIVVPIAGSDGAVRWVLVATFPAAYPIVEEEVFALDLIGQYVARAAKNIALVRELEASRAAVLRLALLKADLVTILAHDFKSPLTTVMGYAELLADGDLDDATRGSAVAAIESASRKLASLANDTLALSRLDASEFMLDIETVDMLSIVEDAALTFALDREIAIAADADGLVVRGDAHRLRQVFENLIGNAIKYSPEGGDITLTLGAEAGSVVVRVRDTGIGIPDADLPLLFERFARGSNAKALAIAGTGLGLFLARSIVASHGGTIALANAPGGGAVATVTLPEAARFVERARPRTLVIAKPTDATAYVAYALRTNGYGVRVAASLDEALKHLARDPYELAIVDATAADVERAADVLLARDGTPLPRILIASAETRAADGWAAVLRTPYLASDVLDVVERVVEVRPA
jgi:signal transduction histidine kinase